MEDIKYWIQDRIEDVKGMFKGGNTPSFSLSSLSDSIENNGTAIFGILLLILLGGFYLFFGSYMQFKQSYINQKIQQENQVILGQVKEKKEKDKELYQNVKEQIIESYKFNIGDLVCFFDNFDKRKINYVNRGYKLQKIHFNEEEQSFEIIVQGIKNYSGLTDLLVLLKQYKTLIDLEKYDIKLTKEKVGIGEIDYYTVGLNGKILN